MLEYKPMSFSLISRAGFVRVAFVESAVNIVETISPESFERARDNTDKQGDFDQSLAIYDV